MEFDAFLLSKAMIVGGLGSWLMMAAYNNLADPNTNITLLNKMMTLESIVADGDLGLGLVGRTTKFSKKIPLLLKTIAFVQIGIALCLLFSSGMLALSALSLSGISQEASVSVATLSMTLFMGMWWFFIIGGLWFGYWIKMGTVQMVHFTLLIISILVITVLNLSGYP
ncbi:DUF2165 family protein [Marinagarivorans cellulosilyticus]|nr:DUF2165 family protein [Marinagarivorans cellulosilyticus]